MTVETLLPPADTEPLAEAARLAADGMGLLARDEPAAARATLRRALALGDPSPSTVLNLALAEDRLGGHARAHGLMRRVAADCPDWDEPALRLAGSLRSQGAAAEAETWYRRTLELNARRTEALAALGGLLLNRGEAREARDLLLRCCGIEPERAEAWDALGLALAATGEPSAGLSAMVEAQRLAPGAIDYALHGVDAAIAAGEQEAEQARLELCCLTMPLNPVCHTALGVLRERRGDRSGAIDALETAAALAPDAALPILLLGGTLARANRLAEAERTLARATALDPANPGPRNDRAAVLMRMHRHAEARALLANLLAEHGDDPAVICNLANATVCLGYQDEAVALARRAAALAPDSNLPRRVLCNTLPYLDGISGAALSSATRDCAARLPRMTMPPFANGRDPARALTVGLLSGTLRTHPVGWLTIAGFETLDPEQFSLICLAGNHSPADPITRRFHAVARDWIDTGSLDDVSLARHARELGIDILIDLGGYGDGARMSACAHRLAPVQIKWVGMQNHSTGLAEMDWMLTDRWETPPDLAHLYSERLLSLPDGYVCYSPPAYAPDTAPSPALANGYVTFGCFNNLAKITPRVIAVWSEILHRVPDARLILKTHQFSDGATANRVRAAFAHHGIEPGRIGLRGASPHRAFLAEYNDIDIVLDPFPYSGGLTTCEALWMGVPTITMPGESFAARHSLSHMSNAGLPDWVAMDAAAYIAMAVARAGNIAEMAAARTGLRARVKASPLCDAARFGRNLGDALRFAWRDWCGRDLA